MKTVKPQFGQPSMLENATAADLMTPEPVTVPADATLREATILLVDRHLWAVPVVDATGRAIGVLSRSDVVAHDRETVTYVPPMPDYYTRGDLTRSAGEALPAGFQVERVDRTTVRDVMTPTVFSVRPGASAEDVVRQLLGREVHRLFVVDDDGVLVGVVSTTDIVRSLLP